MTKNFLFTSDDESQTNDGHNGHSLLLVIVTAKDALQGHPK